MIVICEPLCRGLSHEKVNSGFIYGLRLAFPQETLRFYADITHIEAIKKILVHDNITIKDIEYIPIKFNDETWPIIGMLTYYLFLREIFFDTRAIGVDKIFFLSFSPTILYLIKKLKQNNRFSTMHFTFVLHADFENIADEHRRAGARLWPNKKLIMTRIRQLKLVNLPRTVVRIIAQFIKSQWQSFLAKLFPTKKMLLWKHSIDFKYIALSPHIAVNAEEFIDIKKLNLQVVMLPTVFAEATPPPHNQSVRFAIFGWGDSYMLYTLAGQLAQKDIQRPYEIRLIGQDNRGTAGFPNITCPSPGKWLTRAEMEKYAQDIDMFLVLFEKNRYRLSCSNSILEALSYTKPVLHFNNDCVNTFNKPESPIGIGCDTLEEFVNTLTDIIENYPTYIPKFQLFRDNILKLRKELAVENSATKIKESFTW